VRSRGPAAPAGRHRLIVPVDHRLISRKPLPHGARYYTVVDLHAPGDFDDEIKGWLAESYFDSGRSRA
jgi:hypothetical protein